jgi:hypothetical protein
MVKKHRRDMLSKKLIKFISVTLFLSLLIILSFYIYLKSGISIDSLRFSNYKVENFYLKLNSKLILKASSLEKSNKNIPKKAELKYNNTTGIDGNRTERPLLPNFAYIKKYLNIFIKLLGIFEYVNLENIDFMGKKYFLSYRDGSTLHLLGDRFEFDGKLSSSSDRFILTYPLFHLKRYGLKLKGDLSYDRFSNLNIFGNYTVADINGTYKAELKGKFISFELNSAESRTVKRILDFFRMNPITREWLYNRIAAEKYELIYLRGNAKVVDGRVVPIVDSIEAKVILRDLNVTFHSKLPPIRAKRSIVTLRDGEIDFLFEKPKYRGRAIDGSGAKLLNIYQKRKLTLELHIVYKGVMDEVLIGLLRAYNISIPIKQEGGSSSGVVNLSIPLQKGKKVRYSSSIDIDGGEIIFGKKRYKIEQGKLYIKDNFIELERVVFEWEKRKFIVDGEVDLYHKKSRVTLSIKSLSLPLGVGSLSIRNRKFPLEISWSEKRKIIHIPSMKTKIDIGEIYTEIELNRLSLWRKYIVGLLRLIDGGNIKIGTSNMKDYKIKGTIYWKSSPLCRKNRAVKKWSFRADVMEDGFFLSSRDKSLIYSSKKRSLTIKNLDIDSKLLQSMLKKSESLKSKSKSKSRSRNSRTSKRKNDSLDKFTIVGKNSRIVHPDFTLNCSGYTLKLIKSRKVFKCKIDDTKIDAVLDRHGLKWIGIKGMSDKTLSSIYNFRGIKNTRYTLKVKREEKDY